jgi:hypothetical protein
MKRIESLIILLLAFNPIVVKRDRDYLVNNLKKMRKQGIVIEKLRVAAQLEGTLLGRIIKLDKAVYVISKLFPRTVQIDWVNYGDGWSDARAGYTALLDREYAEAYVVFEDHAGGILPKPKIVCPTLTASPERLKEFTS